jgi:hypothetical protein
LRLLVIGGSKEVEHFTRHHKGKGLIPATAVKARRVDFWAATTLSITTSSTTTLSIKCLYVTLCIRDIHHSDMIMIMLNVITLYGVMLSVIVLNVIMLSVIMPNVVIPSVIMLNVIMLSVVKCYAKPSL